MSYEAAIPLENAAANWYARLPLRSIMSWAPLKEKFLVNFQAFQPDITTEEDFFSLASSMKEKRCQSFFAYSFGLKRKIRRSQMSKLKQSKYYMLDSYIVT
jgi:hypothetical protein